VAPDGSILYGSADNADGGRGYLMKFDSSGNYLTAYDFGWDETPAIYAHDGTYSVIIKDNYYGNGPYYITQLNANLGVEWQFESPTDNEWCVNAPAVDKNGTVYVDSEDGNVYVIQQGGTLKGKHFLKKALGAAYTPIAIGRDGKLYTENDGDMFALGK
jgi:outer membrane protein assembly factor BamB